MYVCQSQHGGWLAEAVTASVVLECFVVVAILGHISVLFKLPVGWGVAGEWEG